MPERSTPAGRGDLILFSDADKATPRAPYAYWYPPVLAQVLVPAAVVLPAMWFTAAWTLLRLARLTWLVGRNVLVALAPVRSRRRPPRSRTRCAR
jgi:hypothetical protein